MRAMLLLLVLLAACGADGPPLKPTANLVAQEAN